MLENEIKDRMIDRVQLAELDLDAMSLAAVEYLSLVITVALFSLCAVLVSKFFYCNRRQPFVAGAVAFVIGIICVCSIIVPFVNYMIAFMLLLWWWLHNFALSGIASRRIVMVKPTTWQTVMMCVWVCCGALFLIAIVLHELRQ